MGMRQMQQMQQMQQVPPVHQMQQMQTQPYLEHDAYQQLYWQQQQHPYLQPAADGFGAPAEFGTPFPDAGSYDTASSYHEYPASGSHHQYPASGGSHHQYPTNGSQSRRPVRNNNNAFG